MTEDDQRRSAADAAVTAAGAAAIRALVDTVARRSSKGHSPHAGAAGSRPSRSAHDYAVPVAEVICAAVGHYLARKGLDVLRERLLPRFLEAFEKRGAAESG